VFHLPFHTLEQLERQAGPFWDRLPVEACYVGPDAAERLGAFAQSGCGKDCLVVSDANTHHVDGGAVLRALRDAGKVLHEHSYPGGPLEATQERADEVAEAGQDCDFSVAVGAGTISDLCKSAGTAQDKPVLLYPTAASMNGYTSGITALKVRGIKRTLPCNTATGIFTNPEVVATAPQRMVAAGVADFLSKCSSSADWRASGILRGVDYSDTPRRIVLGIQEELFEQGPAIGQAEPKAVGLVLEALLLSGFGMIVAGSSSPASGGEHLISHYIDMKDALYGTGHDLHGVQVGLGTLHTLRLWEQVLAIAPETLDLDALVAAQPDNGTIHEWVMEDWGEDVGEEVWKQWTEKALDANGVRAELERFQAVLPDMRESLHLELQPSPVVEKCIADSGGPVQPQDMHAPVEEYEKALKRARFIRNRFTVLDLAAELGLA